MKLLGVIPARGGSKGFPRKNIHPFVGKPLVAWTIEAAHSVSEIDRLICSTDDKEIARIARSYGCEVPIMRPKRLAGDNVPGILVLLHAIEFFEKKGEFFDAAVYLQCTSPLRTAEDIKKAIKKYKQESAKCLISVCEAGHSPYWMYTIGPGGRLRKLLKSANSTLRQQLPKVYMPNGAIYINDVKTVKRTKSFLKPTPISYIMDRFRSVDIDDKYDMLYAEFIYKHILKKDTI